MTYESTLLKTEKNAPLALGAFAPAPKIAAVFCFAVCVSLLTKHSIAFIACCAPFLLAAVSGLSFKSLVRRLLPVNFFFIFLWLFLPVSLSSGTLSLSHSGAELAALITLKGNAVAAMLLVLLGTSSVSASCRGLLKLRLPEKFVTLLLLSYSNLSHMTEEYAKTSAAAKLRGFVPGKRLSSYKTIAYLAAMLLVRSWQRSQRINKAMRLRGFSGQYPLLELPSDVPYSKYGTFFCICISLGSFMLLLANFFL